MLPEAVRTVVLPQLPGWSPDATPRISALESGITNRNFRVEIGQERYVVRIAGANTALLGIDREAERAAASSAHAAGVGPEVVAVFPELGCLVTRFVDGQPIPPEDLQREEVLALVVRSIRKIHGSSPIPGSFWVPSVVRSYEQVARERGVPIPRTYERLAPVLEEVERVLLLAPTPRRPCHNDLLNANLLRQGDHVWIVDYEYAGMGDPFFDLGNFSVNNGLSEEAQEVLLRLYFGTVTPWHRARLALMRIWSDLREGMWGVVQQAISQLDFDYVSYANRHLERCAEAAADPRYRRWLEEAAGTDQDRR